MTVQGDGAGGGNLPALSVFWPGRALHRRRERLRRSRSLRPRRNPRRRGGDFLRIGFDALSVAITPFAISNVGMSLPHGSFRHALPYNY